MIFVGDKPSAKMTSKVPFKGAACEKRVSHWIKSLAGDNRYLVVNSTDPQIHYLKSMILFFEAPVIAFGNEASRALKKLDIPHYKLPHPSGRNRKLNDKYYVAEVLIKCKRWLKERGY